MKTVFSKILIAGFLLVSANSVFAAAPGFDGLPAPSCDTCPPLPPTFFDGLPAPSCDTCTPLPPAFDGLPAPSCDTCPPLPK